MTNPEKQKRPKKIEKFQNNEKGVNAKYRKKNLTNQKTEKRKKNT